jgi:hypothetical protein
MKPSGRVIAQRLLQLEHGASLEDLLERKDQWVEMHYGQRNRQFNPEAVNLTGTA